MQFRILKPNELSVARALELGVANEVGEYQYFPLTEGAVANSIANGNCLGCFLENELIGLCTGFIEDTDIELFQDKIPKSSILTRENFIRYAYVVSAKARGKNITKTLLSESLNLAKNRGYKHALATVALDNGPSINILLKSNFYITYVGKVYGDNLRYVSYQSLEFSMDKQSSLEWILSTDIDRQANAIERGLIGEDLRRENNFIYIGYGKI